MIRALLIPTVILVLFILGAATLMATAPELKPDTPEPIAITVRVQEVALEDMVLEVQTQGSAQPSQETQLIPEVAGRVEWVSPKLVTGSRFDEGDVLLRIDASDSKRSVKRADAALKRAQAEVEHARYEERRLNQLAEKQLVSRSNREDAQRLRRVAEASLAEAEAASAQAAADLERTALKAPFDGLVRDEQVDVGQYLSRGSGIATLYAADTVEVRLPIADRQLAYLDLPLGEQGQIAADRQPRVTLSADYGGSEQQWEGRIVRTEAAIDTASRMVYLVARVDDRSGPFPLNVGLFVQATIEGRTAENIVALPRAALRDRNQVLIIDPENRLRYRDVSLLRLEGDDALVDGGLRQGELVCISALQTALDGMSVIPVQESGELHERETLPPIPSPPLETFEVTRADAS